MTQLAHKVEISMLVVPALALELSERIHGTAVTSLSVPEVWERGGKLCAAASVHFALVDGKGELIARRKSVRLPSGLPSSEVCD